MTMAAGDHLPMPAKRDPWLANGCGRCGSGLVCDLDLGSRGALAGAFVVDGGAPPIAFDV